MIELNIPPYTGRESDYILQAVHSHKIGGNGEFTRRCSNWLQDRLQIQHALLTTSCTRALEMAAVLSGIKPGDEVILPSYTSVSTANAFVLQGANVVFVDIRPDTMNIDETKIEAAITNKTRAVVPVHYAGVSCEMDKIMAIAKRYRLIVIEDAAQGALAEYQGKPLGTIGDFGCFSFHESQNYTMGEGGALLFNNSALLDKAVTIREKGMNRSKVLRGEAEEPAWVDRGSSYLPSDINAAYLWAQLECADQITADRRSSWERYHQLLAPLEASGAVQRPFVPEGCTHNGHSYYIKAKDQEERSRLIGFLEDKGIQAVPHFFPLHSTPAGRNFSRFHGADQFTTAESGRLVRLPLYYGLSEQDLSAVACAVKEFYQ